MAALEGQLGQAKQIAEEADKKYEEVSTTTSHILLVEYSVAKLAVHSCFRRDFAGKRVCVCVCVCDTHRGNDQRG